MECEFMSQHSNTRNDKMKLDFSYGFLDINSKHMKLLKGSIM